MSSLEEKSIATLRASLLRADSAKFCDLWKSATVVKGGNEHDVFQDTISRDVIAYIACRFMFMQNLTIFGGFVRCHYSGKPWNDIDVMFSKRLEDDYKLFGHLIEFVSIILGLPKYCMSYTIHSQGLYGKSADLKFRLQDRDDIVVKFDLVVQTQSRDISSRLPVSVGSCLEMVGTGGVRFRKDNVFIMRRLNHMDVSEVIELLQNGKDIRLCLKTSLPVRKKEQYRNYYWSRITKMLSLDWEFVAIDGPEPPALTQEQLEKVVRETTKKKVFDAARVEL